MTDSSLMYEPVWRRLIKGHYSKCEASLAGFKWLKVKGEHYPGLTKSNKSRVDGILYLNSKNRDLLLLDRFEGKYYKRIPVLVSATGTGEVKAEVYMFKQRYKNRLSHCEWDADKFSTDYMHKFFT